MKLTAEYLESKGWKNEGDNETWIHYSNVSNKKTYEVYINKKDWLAELAIVTFSLDRGEDAETIASNIRTQSRFDRLWSAITEQD